MPCDVITFSGSRLAAWPDTCRAAVEDCGGDPKALLALASASLSIARSGTIGDPGSTDFLRTAALALSTVLIGEART